MNKEYLIIHWTVNTYDPPHELNLTIFILTINNKYIPIRYMTNNGNVMRVEDRNSITYEKLYEMYAPQIKSDEFLTYDEVLVKYPYLFFD